MPIEDIVKTYHTPFYLFDEDILQKRIDYLHQHLTNGELVYAIKANGFLTPYVKVARYEICSYGEFCIAKKSGIPYRPCKKISDALSLITKTDKWQSVWNERRRYQSYSSKKR